MQTRKDEDELESAKDLLEAIKTGHFLISRGNIVLKLREIEMLEAEIKHLQDVLAFKKRSGNE